MNDSLLEKIKKLLRLGQSSNQHEAELALARAFELAARNNIDLADVNIDEKTKKILHEKFRVGARFSLIRKLTLGLVERFFNVHVVLSRPDVIFIGTETDIQIAQYVHNFLTWSCSKSLREYERTQRRKLSDSKRNSFIAGFIYGVALKLDETKAQLAIEDSKTALVLQDAKKRQDYMDQNFKVKRAELEFGRRNYSALEHGFQSGQKVQINPGLGTASESPKLLTL